MHIEQGIRQVPAERAADGRTHGEVRHEVPVHDIDVQRIGACCKRRLGLSGKPAEVRREYGRTNQPLTRTGPAAEPRAHRRVHLSHWHVVCIASTAPGSRP